VAFTAPACCAHHKFKCRPPPGIGTIQGFWASSQASAICAGVAFFRAAMCPSRSTCVWFAFRASGAKRGTILRKSVLLTRSTRPASTSWLERSGCGFMRIVASSGLLRAKDGNAPLNLRDASYRRLLYAMHPLGTFPARGVARVFFFLPIAHILHPKGLNSNDRLHV
jgi:hypothetical protein